MSRRPVKPTPPPASPPPVRELLPVVVVVARHNDGTVSVADQWGSLPLQDRPTQAKAYAEGLWASGQYTSCEVLTGKYLAKWGPMDDYTEPADCGTCGRVLDPAVALCTTCDKGA